ncbi:MAG TPA: hypothetical protein VFV37_00115 [Luteibaculaceae bacterium]|nr:hypothetical protein [Luteibaculaceae bacterium]
MVKTLIFLLSLSWLVCLACQRPIDQQASERPIQMLTTIGQVPMGWSTYSQKESGPFKFEVLGSPLCDQPNWTLRWYKNERVISQDTVFTQKPHWQAITDFEGDNNPEIISLCYTNADSMITVHALTEEKQIVRKALLFEKTEVKNVELTTDGFIVHFTNSLQHPPQPIKWDLDKPLKPC